LNLSLSLLEPLERAELPLRGHAGMRACGHAGTLTPAQLLAITTFRFNGVNALLLGLSSSVSANNKGVNTAIFAFPAPRVFRVFRA
jgi:hypothetical protein